MLLLCTLSVQQKIWCMLLLIQRCLHVLYVHHRQLIEEYKSKIPCSSYSTASGVSETARVLCSLATTRPQTSPITMKASSARDARVFCCRSCRRGMCVPSGITSSSPREARRFVLLLRLASAKETVTGPLGPKAAPSRTFSTNFCGQGTGRQSNVGVPLHQPHCLNSSHPSLIFLKAGVSVGIWPQLQSAGFTPPQMDDCVFVSVVPGLPQMLAVLYCR